MKAINPLFTKMYILLNLRILPEFIYKICLFHKKNNIFSGTNNEADITNLTQLPIL